jgi:hypothetical protein
MFRSQGATGDKWSRSEGGQLDASLMVSSICLDIHQLPEVYHKIDKGHWDIIFLAGEFPHHPQDPSSHQGL